LKAEIKFMAYNQKLVDEHKKYGAVTCSVCKKRTRKAWNIYSVNTICSPQCHSIAINRLLDKASQKMAESQSQNQ